MRDPETAHTAEASALGFYYQTLFALFTLMACETDDAAIGVEQLDDVELREDGQALLFQLKHSLSVAPAPITLKSRALWQTIKVWTDVLPSLTLSETTLHLVTVARIPSDSPLQVLTSLETTREDLAKRMFEEANRVVAARDAAKVARKQPPHAERADGCIAFATLGARSVASLSRVATWLTSN